MLHRYVRQAKRYVYHARIQVPGTEPRIATFCTVPSVTAVLNVLDKPGLMPWAINTVTGAFSAELMAQAATHPAMEQLDAADTVPSTTQPQTWQVSEADISAAAAAAKAAPDALRQAAADAGTGVHTALEAAAAGSEVDVEQLPADARAAATGLHRWLTHDLPAMGWQLAATAELPISHSRLRYAGVLDGLAMDHAGRLVVIDVKSGKNVYTPAAYQIAAYADALGEMYSSGAWRPPAEWMARLATASTAVAGTASTRPSKLAASSTGGTDRRIEPVRPGKPLAEITRTSGGFQYTPQTNQVYVDVDELPADESADNAMSGEIELEVEAPGVSDDESDEHESAVSTWSVVEVDQDEEESALELSEDEVLVTLDQLTAEERRGVTWSTTTGSGSSSGGGSRALHTSAAARAAQIKLPSVMIHNGPTGEGLPPLRIAGLVLRVDRATGKVVPHPVQDMPGALAGFKAALLLWHHGQRKWL